MSHFNPIIEPRHQPKPWVNSSTETDQPRVNGGPESVSLQEPSASVQHPFSMSMRTHSTRNRWQRVWWRTHSACATCVCSSNTQASQSSQWLHGRSSLKINCATLISLVQAHILCALDGNFWVCQELYIFTSSSSSKPSTPTTREPEGWCNRFINGNPKLHPKGSQRMFCNVLFQWETIGGHRKVPSFWSHPRNTKFWWRKTAAWHSDELTTGCWRWQTALEIILHSNHM